MPLARTLELSNLQFDTNIVKFCAKHCLVEKVSLAIMPKSRESKICHYYVDEAGDSTLFSGRGRVIIGEEGCSTYFIMGLLNIPNPEGLSQDLEALRTQMLADPYFKKVPSMQPENRKTALAFHAKDDVPEIRREVFTLLRRQDDLKFLAVVKDKRKVLEYVRERESRDSLYRYNPNELYDFLVRRLFAGTLHKATEYNIYFAQRGKANRTKALREALEIARSRSTKKWKIDAPSLMNVSTMNSAKHAGLQAVDYFLWALQRLYEK